MLQSIVIIIFLATSCEQSPLRPGKPSDLTEETVGYLAESTESVEAKKPVTISISKTTIAIPEDGLGEDAEVRVRTLKSKPEREEVAFLGDAKSDVIEVTMYNKDTDEIYPSTVLDKSYEASQALTDVSDEANLKYVVISAPGTDDELVQVLSRKAITTGAALTAADLSVSIELRVTHVIFYAVESAEESGTVIILDSGKDTSNDSGGSASASSSSSSSTSSSSGGSSIDCSGKGYDPENEAWIPVPSNAEVGQNEDFCVMKYEAKNDGSGNAISKPAGTPWVSIHRMDPTTPDSAMKACADLGTGYTLITNTMWQAIARNIEAQPGNWNGGIGPVGTGFIPRGHSDNSPGACDANQEYVDGDCTNSGNETDFSQKRTHTLSNDAVIWDLAGNVMEWVADDINLTSLNPSLGETFLEFSNASYFPADPGDNRLKFAPLGDYDSSHFIGKLYGGPYGALIRGGRWDSAEFAGVFATQATFAHDSANYIGFRCVWLPLGEP